MIFHATSLKSPLINAAALKKAVLNQNPSHASMKFVNTA